MIRYQKQLTIWSDSVMMTAETVFPVILIRHKVTSYKHHAKCKQHVARATDEPMIINDDTSH